MPLVPEYFSSARLHIRRFIADDAESVFRYASDPDVTRLMDWKAHSDLSMSREFIKATEAEWNKGSQHQWAITRQDTGQVIGAVACGELSHRVSIGYVLAKPAWNMGFATEAAGALVQLVELVPGVARIWATCDTENLASAKVLEKCGLIKEGILRNWSFRPNLKEAVRDSYAYARTRIAGS